MLLLQAITREWRVLLVAVAILLMLSNFLALRYSRGIYANSSLKEQTTDHISLASPPSPPPAPPIPSNTISLPSEYKDLEQKPNTEWCEERYDTRYLVTLAKSQKQYCDLTSTTGRIFCYSTTVGDNGGIDAFCATSPTAFDGENQKFTVDCDPLPDIHPSLSSIPSYWYATGPGLLMQSHLDISPSAPAVSVPERRFSVLVKREDALDNLWHVLMQIESVFFSLDVMSMTTDDQGRQLFTTSDIANTQILVTDDMPDSILYNLWQMVGGRPTRRLHQLSAADLQSEHLIFPLAGKSNPMWQGDWNPHVCAKSELLEVFVNRILRHHGLKPSVKKINDAPLTLTWIDRRTSRSLVDQDLHIQMLKEVYGGVHINVVDFANLTMTEQLATVQKTDILAGIHGAGLTHAMFLAPGATLVEIQPPRLRHRGFRNEAHLARLQYFTAHADDLSGDTDWHHANVTISPEKFLSIIGTAIKAMSQSGLRTDDIA